MEDKRRRIRLFALMEIARVLRWLDGWGYSLVDSDGQPVDNTQIEHLKVLYAGWRDRATANR